MITIAEHQKIDNAQIERLDVDSLRKRINYDSSKFKPSSVNLLRYEFNPDPNNWRDGFYSYFRIGAEWLDAEQTHALVVLPKMRNIDFIGMFMACLRNNETSDEFSSIYDIDFDARPIKSKALSSILSPLLIVQFLMVVKQIANRGLRKDYIKHTENKPCIKGRINLRATEDLALLGHRQLANCTFDEYTVDTPENRLIKRALSISKDIISMMRDHQSFAVLSAMCNQCLSAFDKVSDDIAPKSVTIKSNKLYREYAISARLAKLIIRRQDVAIDAGHALDYDLVPVFRIDMALLFEHFVLSLLRRQFGRYAILYQVAGHRGRFFPDLIIHSSNVKAIVDAKYVDSSSGNVAKPEYIKQLSAYCRDTDILKYLGYGNEDEDKIPVVPCIIAHPCIGGNGAGKLSIFARPVAHTVKFYTLPIAIPIT